MHTIDLTCVSPRGELASRSALLAARLELPLYRPDAVFHTDESGWPGDNEGRTILALTLLAHSTKKEPAYLDEIIRRIPAHLNEKGYLNRILPAGEFDEQQLSGHGWFLRGLCEYYIYKQDSAVLAILKGVVENLYLPLCGRIGSYPAKLEQRVIGGQAAGEVAGKVGNWYISTDTGCAFISLDGLTQAYALLRDPRLLQLLHEMIDGFAAIDVAGILAQTHATLTALRGILRLYGLTGEARLLQLARKLFSLYVEEGMTASYANYNWFGRPEWTEPCAIIDSFLAAMQLYGYTRDTSYLDTAQAIYYNGICHAQRPNGGFGCDSCAGHPQGSGRQLYNKIYEASWCCTMRGGEGLARAAQYGYWVEEDTLFVPYLSSSTACIPMNGGVLELEQWTGYPYTGEARFTVRRNTAGSVKLAIYLPAFCQDAAITGVTARHSGSYLVALLPEEGTFTLTFSLSLRTQPPEGRHNAGSGLLLLHGPLILGCDNPEAQSVDCGKLTACPGDAVYSDGKDTFFPICNTYLLEGKEQAERQTLHILF